VSERNVKLALAALDAYNAGDLDALMGFYAPDVEVVPDLPEARPLHGREKFRSFLEEANSAWVDPRWKVVEIYAVDRDRVMFRDGWGGKGRSSGISAVAGYSAVQTFRDGLTCASRSIPTTIEPSRPPTPRALAGDKDDRFATGKAVRADKLPAISACVATYDDDSRRTSVKGLRRRESPVEAPEVADHGRARR
jgi:ketosteroid isomerase-like protein